MGNEHDQLSSYADPDPGKVVSFQVVPQYDNHDDWPSQIGAPDYPTWMIDFPSVVSYVDNADGTSTTTIQIFRAGEYTLDLKVDGVHISDSPKTLKVEPAYLYEPYCVVHEVPPPLYAGITHTIHL